MRAQVASLKDAEGDSDTVPRAARGPRCLPARCDRMPCSCLPGFGKKKKPAPPAGAGSAPGSDGEAAPGGSKPTAAREQSAQQAAQDAIGQSDLRDEVPPNRGVHDSLAVGVDRARKTAAPEGISPSDVNGQFDAVPDWVQKSSVPGAAGEQERIGVVGEVGSIHHGSGDGFQTRATPRSVFRKAVPSSGSGGMADGAAPAVRPPRPHAASGGSNAAGMNASERMQIDPSKEPQTDNGLPHERAQAQDDGEVLVRDSDPQCIPGANVLVSKRWQHVPYFKQFNGLRGKLTRRGVNGATWYAAFAGCPEQAFSTGMHGQYILCYAPVRLLPAREQQAVLLRAGIW